MTVCRTSGLSSSKMPGDFSKGGKNIQKYTFNTLIAHVLLPLECGFVHISVVKRMDGNGMGFLFVCVCVCYFSCSHYSHADGEERPGRSVLLPQPEALPAAAGALVPPPLSASLHAEVLGDCLSALLAPHRAAPVEFAVAAGHRLGPALLHGQAALAAQPLAAPLLPLAQALALLQALATFRAGQAQGAVLQAVVRRVLQVDQLLARDGPEGLGDGPPAGGAVPGPSQEVHLQGSVVLLFQIVAHLPELGQLQPAGLGGAASGHAVTLARPLHGPLHGLGTPEGQVRQLSTVGRR